MEQEIWKPIPGYEGVYEVSSYGNIRSVERNVQAGKNILNIKSKHRKLDNHTSGYLKVTLCLNSVLKKYYVHRLVYCVFNNISLKERMFVNHLDFNKHNNALLNLEQVNVRENTTYSIDKSSCSSRFIGVSAKYHKGKFSSWAVAIHFNKKRKHVGNFATEEEAHKAYLQALKEYGLENKYATKSQDNS